MTDRMLRLTLNSPEQTAALAVRLGALLHAGDTVLLEGPIGAGKTHFARSLIQSLLPAPEDVPSPTFTLIQTYDAMQCEIWHADLYRLTDPAEVVELGLLDAFPTAICLIEWPDRLQSYWPDAALVLQLIPDAEDDRRVVEMRWTVPSWDARLRTGLHDFA